MIRVIPVPRCCWCRASTPGSEWRRWDTRLALFVGIGAQVSGFLLHAITGQPAQMSLGTVITVSGAVLLASALIVLVYGLIKTPRPAPDDVLSRDRPS